MIRNRDHLFEMKAGELVQRFAQELRLASNQTTELISHIQLVFGEKWSDTPARDMIDELSLLAPADEFDPNAEAVTLMTLHMAKGLEFRVVFISGVEDGFIPYRSQKVPEDVEEERRLFYVGMTRAKDELFLIAKRSGFLYGRKSVRTPSPFLSDIPEEHVRKVIISNTTKKSNQKKQMKLF